MLRALAIAMLLTGCASLRGADARMTAIQEDVSRKCQAFGGDEIYPQPILEGHVVYWCCKKGNEGCLPINEYEHSEESL